LQILATDGGLRHEPDFSTDAVEKLGLVAPPTSKPRRFGSAGAALAIAPGYCEFGCILQDQR
jgi:hypothetical protein